METTFLDLIETFRAEDASRDRLFGGEGTGVRRARRGSRYETDLAEAFDVYAEAFKSRRGLERLKEALTTADFPLYFGDIIDRQMLARYATIQPVYRDYFHIAQVNDFRTVKRFAIDGSEAVLGIVAQGEEYPESKLSDTVYQYAVQKRGRAIPFNWEVLVDDDLDGLKNIPSRFANAAARSEQFFATGLYCDAAGPNAAFYTAGNKNQVVVANGASSANPVLSIQGLQDAMVVLHSMVDLDGEPIFVDMAYLVVPPALEIIANNIIHAQELWLQGAGGTANQQVHVGNWMRDKVQVRVDPYIPRVVTGPAKTTCWFLVADPTDQRPAFEIGFLKGHLEPEIFMKEPNAIRLGGGGQVSPLDGDFDTDSVRYKVRHVFGGTRMDPRMTVASTGQAV